MTETHIHHGDQTLIASVQRALRVVDLVAEASRPLPVKVIARCTGLSLGTAYNIVRTLVHEGYLVHEVDGVVLGDRFPGLRLGDDEGLFLARVRGTLRAVATELGWTAYLSRYDDGEVNLVDIVDSPANPRLDLWVGLQDSAHATALGKQILAELSEVDRIDYVHRHRLDELTPHTISDRRTLLSQLERIRGTALDRQEYAIGFTCLAVPVITPEVTGALAISVPAHTSEAEISALGARLSSYGSRLSLHLGADQFTM
ncbi:IclR family transcriptional regulator [Ruania zhangjianzhongii]|uniref:IclR family transcriptional regulator n=1 Tax=Ruania zhangjianzhongii TaxID=2603206 RepID=UPI0011CC8893|nr:IclR family transcriptional regulator C-terminal domain-containing protein [Ruania zhangjianzhongii]